MTYRFIPSKDHLGREIVLPDRPEPPWEAEFRAGAAKCEEMRRREALRAKRSRAARKLGTFWVPFPEDVER